MGYRLNSPRTSNEPGYHLDPLQESKKVPEPEDRVKVLEDLLSRREQIGRTAGYQRPVHDLDLFGADTSAQHAQLAQGLSNAARGFGSFNGKMPDNPTSKIFPQVADQAYKDFEMRRSEQERGDKMLLQNMDLRKVIDDEKRKATPLPESSRKLMEQRIHTLPIEGTEKILLPEGITIGQVENDPVLNELLKDLIPKTSMSDEIKRAEMLAQQQMDGQPLSAADREILTKKLQGAGYNVPIPDGMTYGQAKKQPYLSQFIKSMHGFGNEIAQMRFGFEQEKYQMEREAREIERKARQNERKESQNYRKEQDRITREDRLKKDAIDRDRELRKEARPSEKSIEQLAQYDTALALLNDIKKRKPKFDTGRGASSINAGAQLLGLDDPEYSAFKADVNDQLAQYIKNISGAAASDKERGFLSQIQVSTNDNDKTFMAKIDSAIEKVQRAREAHVEAQSRIGKDVTNMKEPLVSESKFPMTLRKDGKAVSVSNEQELKEAQAEGWK